MERRKLENNLEHAVNVKRVVSPERKENVPVSTYRTINVRKKKKLLMLNNSRSFRRPKKQQIKTRLPREVNDGTNF